MITRDNFTTADKQNDPQYELDEYGIVSSGEDIGLDTNTEKALETPEPEVETAPRSDEETAAEIEIAKGVYGKLLVNAVSSTEVYPDLQAGKAVTELVEQTAPYLADAADTSYMRMLVNDGNDVETALKVMGTVVDEDKLQGDAKEVFGLFKPNLGSIKTKVRERALSALVI